MIQFLKRLFGYFAASDRRPDLLPARVADSEPLTRFLFSDKLFAASKSRVKRHAFTPRNGEASIFRTLNLSDQAIWEVGKENVGEDRGQQPRARADLSAKSVRQASLDVVAETSRHPRHGNIVDWPEGKERQRLATMELANQSVLVLAENPDRM